VAPITLTAIATDFNSPVGIDYHEPTGQVVMSVNYPAGTPSTFELVDAAGAHTAFSSASGFQDEVKIATVRSGPHQGGFTAGEVFAGTGYPGVIARISADGTVVQNPWVTLPDEQGLLRGSLVQDRYGVFDGDLIVVTTTGGVWRVTSAGEPTRLADLGVHLEGVTTVPDLPRYGPWAGKIVVGAEQQAQIHAIGQDGTIEAFSIGVAPEDIEIVPAGENFFGVDFGGRTLWGAPASAFAGMVGDFLIPQESGGVLWHVWWDATSGEFQSENVAQVSQWEHVTFSSAGIDPIEAVDTRVLWLNHLDLLPGDPSVTTSYNAAGSGIGSGLAGLVINSNSTGEQTEDGANKVVWMAVAVPPGYRVRAVRLCYELSDPRSFISQIRLDQVQNPPASATVLLDDATDQRDAGPICIDSTITSIDPSAGPLLLSLRTNFADSHDAIVITGVGLRLQPVIG
jgi:hypothetical protein